MTAMLASALLILSAQAAGEPPKTVNGQELGAAEDFTDNGPATVCMRQLVIRAKEDQSVQLGYSGIHFGTVRLFLADGKFVDFTDGEIFMDQRRNGEGPLDSRRDLDVYLLNDSRPDVRYQIEGTGKETDDYSPPRIMVSGTGLRSHTLDDRIFDQVSFAKEGSVHCDRRYAYGWGVLLDEEPFAIPARPVAEISAD